MEQILIQPVAVLIQKVGEAQFVVGGQKMNPCPGDGVVIEARRAVMLGEPLDSLANAFKGGVKRLAMKVDPCQAKMVGVLKLGVFERAGVKCREKLFIV
jgi:hypothetical protein